MHEARLGDVVVSMKNGIYKPASEYADDGMPCLRMYNIDAGSIVWRDIKRMRITSDEYAAYGLHEGDLLVNRVNSRELVGKTACIAALRERSVFESKNIRVRIDPSKALPKFINYQLLARGHLHFSSNAQQVVGMASISQKQLADFPIVLTDLDKQYRIVSEIEKQFSRLDEAVANLKRVKANLKRYKAAVLKAAVEGRLVPTEAELARQEGRSYETGEQLLKRILEARRAQWRGKGKYREPAGPDTTGLPMLPEGWAWSTWGQIGFSQNGTAFPSSEYSNSGVKLLRPGNLDESGKIDWTDKNTRLLPQQYADENPDLIVGSGELLMNLTAQSLKDEFLGRVCLSAPGEYCLLNQRLARLTPVLIPTAFALVVFKSRWFRKFVDGLNTGSLIQHMFTTQLAEFTFPLPPLLEQRHIVAEVDRRLSLARGIDHQVDTNLIRAGAVRQALLERAFNPTSDLGDTTL